VRIFIIIALVLIIGGISGFVILDRMNSSQGLSLDEKHKALTQLLGREPVLESGKEDTTWIVHKGNLISFSYPKVATVYPQPSQAADHDQFSFGLTAGHILAVIQVQDNATVASLEDVPAVQIREKDDNYQGKSVTASGVEGKGFIKTVNGIEETGFFLNNGRLYSIAVSGNSEKEVGEVFEKVIASIKF
jgi:hypothetical protein